MAKTKTATSPLPYLQRLLEDQYVQEQISDAAVAARNAYSRAARKRAQATEDKKLYTSLRHAATSVRNAAVALRRAPEPPPKHHVRNFLIIAVAIAATVGMTKLAQKQINAARSNIGPSTVDGNGPVQSAGTEPGEPRRSGLTSV
jgi:hypothetical protein